MGSSTADHGSTPTTPSCVPTGSPRCHRLYLWGCPHAGFLVHLHDAPRQHLLPPPRSKRRASSLGLRAHSDSARGFTDGWNHDGKRGALDPLSVSSLSVKQSDLKIPPEHRTQGKDGAGIKIKLHASGFYKCLREYKMALPSMCLICALKQ